MDDTHGGTAETSSRTFPDSSQKQRRRRTHAWLQAVLIVGAVCVAVPIALYGAVYALIIASVIADPGNDGATPLVNGYNLWRLKGRARAIVFGNGEAGESKQCVPARLPVLGDPIVEVGRVAVVNRLVVGELMRYPSGPGIDVKPAGWFVLDTDAGSAIEWDDHDVWTSELRARGINPAVLKLEMFP